MLMLTVYYKSSQTHPLSIKVTGEEEYEAVFTAFQAHKNNGPHVISVPTADGGKVILDLTDVSSITQHTYAEVDPPEYDGAFKGW